MSPYRAAPPERRNANPKVTFALGGPLRLLLLNMAGLLLVATSIALVIAWLLRGGGIHGSVLVPAIAGATLLARTRAGSLELGENRVVRVKLATLLGGRPIDVPVTELMGVTVMPVGDRSQEWHELRLVLTHGRHVALVRGSTPEYVERARSAVAAFVLEHDLLQGHVEEQHGRVGAAGDAGPNADADADADADAGESERGRSIGRA